MNSFIVSSLSTRSEGRMVIMRQPLFVPGCMSILRGMLSTVKSSPSVWTINKHYMLYIMLVWQYYPFPFVQCIIIHMYIVYIYTFL